jgi:TonB family protein
MHADTDLRQRPTNARIARRRAFALMIAFVVLSTAVHFTLGPAMTQLSPHWAYPNLPDQALSIVTLSHKNEAQVQPKPTPTPTPPPIPLPRTKRNLALLKYLEMGHAVHLRLNVRPPARRKANIVLDRPATPRPHNDAREADVVVAMQEPTPASSPASGGARADTGGKADHLSGSLVWGDDNQVRLLKRAPLSIDDRGSGTARVQIDVGPDGQVLSVQLVASSGDSGFDQAALECARNSTFAPATLNGMPVHGSYTLDFPPASTTM